jgi:hypothetical protein
MMDMRKIDVAKIKAARLTFLWAASQSSPIAVIKPSSSRSS